MNTRTIKIEEEIGRQIFETLWNMGIRHNEGDVEVLVYPGKIIVITDIFDKYIYYGVPQTVEDIEKILREGLPWCFMHEDPLIHYTYAKIYVIEINNTPRARLIEKIRYYSEIPRVARRIAEYYFS